VFDLVIEGRERLIYDANFEKDVIARCDELREQREKEAEQRKAQDKNIQEALLKEWLEQQTTKQNTPSSNPPTSNDAQKSDQNITTTPNNDSLVDLHFPSPRNSPQFRHAKVPRIDPSLPTTTTNPADDLPPPYPGPSHLGQQSQSPAIAFPAPPPYPSTVSFPAPNSMGLTPPSYGSSMPPLTMSQGWPMTPMGGPSSTPFAVLPMSTTTPPTASTPYPYYAPPTVAFPQPTSPMGGVTPQHPSPKRSQSDLGYRPNDATLAVPPYDYNHNTNNNLNRSSPVSRNAPGPGGNGFTHTTTTGSKIEDYVKKYPVLATNGVWQHHHPSTPSLRLSLSFHRSSC